MSCDEFPCGESPSETTVSTSDLSSDCSYVLNQIKNDAKKLKIDQKKIAIAVEETLTAPDPLISSHLTAKWLKLNTSERMSLINYKIVMYSTRHYLMFYDLDTGKKEFFTPHMIDNNTGISTFAGLATMNIFGVADIAVRSKVSIFDFPAFNIIAVLSDNCEGTYEDIAFSGDRMVMTLKRSTVVSLTLWDWKRKVKYFTVERQSFSTTLSLRGDTSMCSFALMSLGAIPHLDVWEMSIFSNIISLLTKFCDEDKHLNLTDLCLDHGDVYAIDVLGHIYRAHQLSADHLKFMRIISNCYEYTTYETKDHKGPFIQMSGDILAAYGPQLVIRIYGNDKGEWGEHQKIQLENPILHLLTTPSGETLIAWDEKQGLIKITDTDVKVLSDRRMISRIREMEIIHPDDICCVTLHDDSLIQFWTIDEGFHLSMLTLDQKISGISSHPFVPYLVLTSASHGELIIVDVQEIRRPHIFKMVYITFEPLSSIIYNFSGSWIIACGANNESIYTLYGDTRHEFKVKKGVITRYPYSSVTTLRGSVEREWVVLLLNTYKHLHNHFIQLLTVPTLSETCIINLEDSYLSLHCCSKYALLLLGVRYYDVKVHEISLDHKKGTIENKVEKPKLHLFPPLALYMDRYHVMTYGLNDGCVVLYGSEISDSFLMVSPLKYDKISKALITRKANFLLVLTKKSELIAFKIEVPCGHTEDKHEKQEVSYPYLRLIHTKILKRIKREMIPWDEKEGISNVTSYKGGPIKMSDKKIYPQALTTLLNSADKEEKLKTLRECQGNFDPSIVIAYIKKWLNYYRAVAKKFVEHNTYLERERKSEMIPWDSIRKVEARANKEYYNHYKNKIKLFEDKVGSQLSLWKNRHERILNDTWLTMSHNPRHLKMIFRNFHTQDFGFLKAREDEYKNIDKKIQFSYSDAIMHSSSQNLIWDARFECYANYWPEYYRYLIDEVEGHEEETEKAQEEEDTELLVENYDEFFITGEKKKFHESPLEEKTSAAAIFQRKFDSKVGLTSCVSMSMNKARRAMDVASNLLMIRKAENASMEKFFHEPGSWSLFDLYNHKNLATKFSKRIETESVESLFVDSEEDCFDFEEDKAVYIKNKKRNLKKLLFQYPYLDELHSELFPLALKLPEDFPEECIFRASQTLPFELNKQLENEKFILETCSAVDLYGVNVNNLTNVGLPSAENIEQQQQVETTSEVSKDNASSKDNTETVSMKGVDLENESESTAEKGKIINIADIPVPTKILTARQVFDDKEKEVAKATLHRTKSQLKAKRAKKPKVVDDFSESTMTEGHAVPLDFKEINRKKRLSKDLEPKSTDKLNIIIKTEEELHKTPLKPVFLLAKKDIAKLYLMLDVEILLEIAKKKRKKRKSSIDKLSLEEFKHFEAEDKIQRMSKVYSDIRQELSSHLANIPSLTSENSLSKNLNKSQFLKLKELVEESSSELVLNNLYTEKRGGESTMSETEKERRTIIMGDVWKLKKRRIILGKKMEQNKETLKSEMEGFEGVKLQANYISNQRNKIKTFIVDASERPDSEFDVEPVKEFPEGKESTEVKEPQVVKEPTQEPEAAAEESEGVQEEEPLNVDDLCWFESAKNYFEMSKLKKLEEEAVPLTEDFIEPEEKGDIDFFDPAGQLSVHTDRLRISDVPMIQEVGKKRQKEQSTKTSHLKALFGISSIEDGIYFLMLGSTPHHYVTTNLYRSSQLINTSALNIDSETAHDKKVLFDIMSYFNIQFKALRDVKESVMDAIQKHQQQFFYLVNEISVACKENYVFPKMPSAVWSQYENPEKVITVEDSEVPVEKFMTPSDIDVQKYLNALSGVQQKKPTPDPFRLEALMVMMDGVVEKRWEDELKKDIELPSRLVDKDPMLYDAEDLELLKEYEKEVEERTAERQKYKAILLDKIQQELNAIEVLHSNFDWRVKQMDEKSLEFRQIINEEKMRSVRRYREKAKEVLFLRIIEQARTFNEATKASMDQIEGLIKALSQRMKLQKEKLSLIKKKRDHQEEKLDGTLHKMGVIPADRSYVMVNYIRPAFNIQEKFNHANFLITVLEKFEVDPSRLTNSDLIEIFKDIKQAMKKNCPQKFPKSVWDVLMRGRKDHIHSDIEIAILQIEYSKAEETGKFFKGYLKQKRNFSEMIKKAVENSIQRYKMSQHLKEYQVVLPLGMVEVNLRWQERGEPPVCPDLLLLSSQDYEDLLADKYDVDMEFAFEEWLNEYYSHDIDILTNKHYDYMTEEKELLLTIKHIEKFQHTVHSRGLIRTIKESGVHPSGWSMGENKKLDESIIVPAEPVHATKLIEEIPMDTIKEKKSVQPSEDVYFINPSIQDIDYAVQEEDLSSSEEFEISNGDMSEDDAEPEVEDVVPMTSEDDIAHAPELNYLFLDDMEEEQTDHEESSKFDESETSVEMAEGSKSAISIKSKEGNDNKEDEEKVPSISEDVKTEQSKDESLDVKKSESRHFSKGRKFSRKSLSLQDNFFKLRELKILAHYRVIRSDLKSIYLLMLRSIREIIKHYQPKQKEASPSLSHLTLPLPPEDLQRQGSGFSEKKMKYLFKMSKEIKKNIAVLYPMVSAEEKEVFVTSKPIKFENILDINALADHILYEKDTLSKTNKPQSGPLMSRPITGHRAKDDLLASKGSNTLLQEEYLKTLLKQKEEFKFTGDWHQNLILLWQELNKIKSIPKKAQKDMTDMKRFSLLGSFWEYSEFNFKQSMKDTLVSLLNSYKGSISRYALEYKKIENEITKYINMNSKCVQLFFSYELSLSREDTKSELLALNKEHSEFYATRNVKIQMAMKKARLLREIQKNQYDIMSLQSELELLHLKTYPILMFKRL